MTLHQEYCRACAAVTSGDCGQHAAAAYRAALRAWGKHAEETIEDAREDARARWEARLAGRLLGTPSPPAEMSPNPAVTVALPFDLLKVP